MSMSNTEIIQMLYNLLRPVQQSMFQDFYKSKERKTTIHSARRIGKSFLLVIIACITAYSKSNAQIRYASVNQKAVRKMIKPIFKDIGSHIPIAQRPTWNSFEGAYVFPNGSMIHVLGVNAGRADDARGTASDICIVDEAAFVDELSYLVDSVLMPQLISTGGKLIMASSSPISPAHEFVSYIQECRMRNSYYSYTIYEAGYTPELIAEFCKEAGGEHSTTWQREYLNAVVTDETQAIIPEWKSDFVKEAAHDEYYSLYHRYCSADWGVRDKTAILWAYYDFKQGKIFIEDEFTCNGQESTTRNIAANIRLKETSLGYDEIYRRPADNNELILLQDLGSEFDIHFYPTSKDTLAAMVNEARLWVQNARVFVHPRCKELISCLQYGVFQDRKRKEFGRSKTLGHYDALASFIYLIRNIDQQSNPIPANHSTNEYSHYTPPDYTAEINIKKIFNL